MSRIAFVGTGWQGQGHMKTMSQMEGAELVGLCDLDEARAKRAGEKFGVAPFADYSRMLDETRPHGVVICTPPEARLDLVQGAARRGIHCFIEKPPAKTLEAADAVARVLADSGIINSVGFMYRYSHAVDKARELLAGRRVALVRSQLLDGLALRPDWPRWFFNKAISGGPIVDQAIHMFDLCRYILGEVDSVGGFQANRTVPKGGDFTVEDSFSLALRYESGVLQNHTHSWAFPSYVSQVEFLSDELHLVLDLAKSSLTGTVGGESVSFAYPEDALYRLELEAFVQAIRTGRRDLVRSTYQDSVQSLAVTLAAAGAVENGTIVKV
jgi:predicted dehydrogenase